MFNIHFFVERWKWSADFGIYVSNRGHFRSRDKKDLPIKIGNGGYCYVYCEGTVNRYLLAHRVVMLVWKPTLNAEGLTVDHLDHNKRNNSLTNLEWVTREENLRRAKRDYIGDVDYNYNTNTATTKQPKKTDAERYRDFMKTITHFMIEPDTRNGANANRPTLIFPLTPEGFAQVKEATNGVVTSFDIKTFKGKIQAMQAGANRTGRFYYCGMYVHPFYQETKGE